MIQVPAELTNVHLHFRQASVGLLVASFEASHADVSGLGGHCSSPSSPFLLPPEERADQRPHHSQENGHLQAH